MRAAAADLGKELIEVETNMRAITDPYETWHLAHGIGIAAVALLLQGQLERIYVPASFAYADLAPWGTHPLLDPLWGTEAIDLVHDGCELVRAEKVAADRVPRGRARAPARLQPAGVEVQLREV